MAISDESLLEFLACPEDKGPLWYFAQDDVLYNPRLKRKYLIRDGIPVLLIDEAETVDQADHDKLMKRAEVEGVGPNFDEATHA
jgi:uncharacterized protein YbaR (Trm112 family)